MECIFCRIVSGDIPTAILASSNDAIAFRDLNPHAPVHVLVVPKAHVSSAAAIAPGQVAAVLGPVMQLAVEVARGLELPDRGYRLVINTGRDGGQSVDHLHVHLLGGRPMGWPPG